MCVNNITSRCKIYVKINGIKRILPKIIFFFLVYFEPAVVKPWPLPFTWSSSGQRHSSVRQGGKGSTTTPEVLDALQHPLAS